MQPPEWVNGAWIDHLEQELLHAHDPTTTDAERTPADLKTIAKECTHLPKDEQRQLLKIRQKIESLFDGTLGVWKTAPVDLELKDPHVKPYHAKPYPVPYSQEKKTQRRNQRSCSHSVLQKIQNSGVPHVCHCKTRWFIKVFTVDIPRLLTRVWNPYWCS